MSGGLKLVKSFHRKGKAVIQDELKAFLANLQNAFYTGDLHALYEYMQLPLVVYTAAGVVVLRDEAEFEHMAQDYLTAMQALSVTHGLQTILTREPMVHNRQRVTVRSVELNAKEETVTSSTIRYFVLKTETGYVVEMMEYLEIPLPVSDVEKIIH